MRTGKPQRSAIRSATSAPFKASRSAAVAPISIDWTPRLCARRANSSTRLEARSAATLSIKPVEWSPRPSRQCSPARTTVRVALPDVGGPDVNVTVLHRESSGGQARYPLDLLGRDGTDAAVEVLRLTGGRWVPCYAQSVADRRTPKEIEVVINAREPALGRHEPACGRWSARSAGRSHEA